MHAAFLYLNRREGLSRSVGRVRAAGHFTVQAVQMVIASRVRVSKWFDWGGEGFLEEVKRDSERLTNGGEG